MRMLSDRFFAAGFLAAVLAAATVARAEGPEGEPVHDGTVKAAAGVPRDLFARQLPLIESRRAGWLAAAEAAKPKLFERTVSPVRLVTPKADPKAFLGWRFEDAGDPASAYGRALKPDDVLYFDFGEHLTGFFTYRLGRMAAPVDAPVRLRFEFGEVPAETILPCSV